MSRAGGLVLTKSAALEEPFFLKTPPWALLGKVLLATIATVIARQAAITNAFSMTRQAMQLGLLPRFGIRHTCETGTGQIFLPVVNVLLLASVLSLVTQFQTSTGRAAHV